MPIQGDMKAYIKEHNLLCSKIEKEFSQLSKELSKPIKEPPHPHISSNVNLINAIFNGEGLKIERVPQNPPVNTSSQQEDVMEQEETKKEDPKLKAKKPKKEKRKPDEQVIHDLTEGMPQTRNQPIMAPTMIQQPIINPPMMTQPIQYFTGRNPQMGFSMQPMINVPTIPQMGYPTMPQIPNQFPQGQKPQKMKKQ